MAHKTQKSFVRQLVESLVIVLPIAFIIRTFGYGLYQVPTGSMETTLLVGERFFADKFTVLFRSIERGDIIAFNQPTFPYSSWYPMELFQRYVYGPINWTKRVIGTPGDELKGVIEEGRPVVYIKRAGEAEFSKLEEPYVNKHPIVIYPEFPDWSLFGSVSNSISFVHRTYDPKASPADQPFYAMTSENIKIGQMIARQIGVEWMEGPHTPLYEHSWTSSATPMRNGKNARRTVDEFHVKLGQNQYWVMGDNRLGSSDSRSWGVLDGKFIHGKIVFRIWSMDSSESWWILDLIKHPINFWKKVRWSRCMQTVK